MICFYMLLFYFILSYKSAIEPEYYIDSIVPDGMRLTLQDDKLRFKTLASINKEKKLNLPIFDSFYLIRPSSNSIHKFLIYANSRIAVTEALNDNLVTTTILTSYSEGWNLEWIGDNIYKIKNGDNCLGVGARNLRKGGRFAEILRCSSEQRYHGLKLTYIKSSKIDFEKNQDSSDEPEEDDKKQPIIKCIPVNKDCEEIVL